MIHVLGAGNIGSLFATSLARKSPVNLILKPSSLKSYVDMSQSTVRVHTPKIGGALWESQIPAVATSHLEKPISQLIVAVKAHDILKAIRSVRSHIARSTEILILHNGMGVREQLLENWQGELPNLAFGVTDAGVKRNPPLWTFEYTGRGLCTVSSPKTQKHELMDKLCAESELLHTEQIPWDLFEVQQKRKLAVNSVINPLTALMQCYNGDLLQLDEHYKVIYRIMQESCKVLHLNKDEMMDVVVDVIQRTAKNVSSMLSDVNAGRQSEIDYINGYIVREAQKLGIAAPVNKMLLETVKMRIIQTRKEQSGAIPLFD